MVVQFFTLAQGNFNLDLATLEIKTHGHYGKALLGYKTGKFGYFAFVQ